MFKRKRLWIIPIIVALVAVTGVFAAPGSMPGAGQGEVALAAGAEQAEEHCIHANQEQLGKIKELWEQDITVGELLEQVFPEVLKGMPQNSRLHLLEGEVPWFRLSKEGGLSQLDVCWNSYIGEDDGWAWIWFGSEGKCLCGYVSDYVSGGSREYSKGRTIRFDEQGKPIVGPVITKSREQIEQEIRQRDKMKYNSALQSEETAEWREEPKMLGQNVGASGQTLWGRLYPFEYLTMIIIERGWYWDGTDVTAVFQPFGCWKVKPFFWHNLDSRIYDLGPDPPM